MAVTLDDCLQPHEVGGVRLGHQGHGLPGDGGTPGTLGDFSRSQRPRGPGRLLPVQHFPEPTPPLCEETVHADKGVLGLTTKYIHFAGSRKRSRVRCDRILAFDPYKDGFGIMRDAQTAKPQAFRTKGGWFVANLAHL